MNMHVNLNDLNDDNKPLATVAVPAGAMEPETKFALNVDFLLTRERGVLVQMDTIERGLRMVRVLVGHRDPLQPARELGSYGLN